MAFPTLSEILVAVKALIKSYNENSAEIASENIELSNDEYMGYTKNGVMYKVKSKILRLKLGTGSPADVYATYVDLVADDPNKDYIYLVTADGNWYYWDIGLSSWESGGIYQDSAAFNDLAGSGRTDETVKGNTDTIATKESVANVDALKGTGWVNETVKDNADDIDVLDTRMTAEEDKLPFRNIFPNLHLHPSRYPELASLDVSKVMYFRCSAGYFNAKWENPSGRLWIFPEGSVLHSDGTTPIRTSTDEQPDVDVPAGIVTLHSDAWAGNYQLSDASIDVHFIGDMADIPLVTHYLVLRNCSQLTGDLSDCPVVDYMINLGSDSLITGAYTQVSDTNVPTFTYFEYMDISSADMDATLIAYEACTKDNGTFTANGMTRTTASDDAVSYLTGHGWSITGLTVV